MSAEGWPGRLGGPAFEHYPGASVNTRPFDSLSSWWQGEGGCVCAEAGVRREYNPFVSTVSVATAVMKNKNWINKTYFFLSGVAIRHRLPNLPPVCAQRNARCRQSAQLCLNRGPLPVTPGGLHHRSHMGGCGPQRTEKRLWSPTKARRQAWEMNYAEAKGMHAKQWCLPCCLSVAQAESSASRLFRGTSEKTNRNRPLCLNQPDWFIDAGPVSAPMIKI